MTAEPLISVDKVSKSFGDVLAVDSISFTVNSGEIFGFLGPNGAGKTTTINMMTGLARIDSGSIVISGIDCGSRPKKAQRLMGIVPDESNLYPELTGYENLCFCGSLYGMDRCSRQAGARRLLEDFGLSEAADRKFAGYSKGMKRKLTIAAGIIHEPPILFLDEPTTGIDVASARQIRALISELNRSGTTIFLTTHYIEEAERLCRRIAFIVRGRIVRVDTVEALMQPLQDMKATMITITGRSDVMAGMLAEEFRDLHFAPHTGNGIRVESKRTISIGPLVRYIEEHGSEVLEARRLGPSLEEVFVEVTGIELNIMKREKERSGGKK